MIYQSEGTAAKNIPKMQFLQNLSGWIKSYGNLSGLLASPSQLYHDVCLITLKSCDHGYQFWDF